MNFLLWNGLKATQKAIAYPHNIQAIIARISITCQTDCYCSLQDSYECKTVIASSLEAFIAPSSSLKAGEQERSFQVRQYHFDYSKSCAKLVLSSAVESYQPVLVGT